jgi:hypothetical protein
LTADYTLLRMVGFPSTVLKRSDWVCKGTISFVISYGFRIWPLIFKARGQTRVIFEQGAEGYVSTADSNSKKGTEKLL